MKDARGACRGTRRGGLGTPCRASLLGLISVCAIAADSATAQDRVEHPIKVAAFGALTGPVRSFGINSRAALQAASERIDQEGGIRLADGSIGRFDVSYADDHCKPDDAIAIVREAVASDALLALGPSCSSVAEPLYGALQRRVDDADDHGIEIPVFTDGATKADLARISEWAFRNAPNEGDMYRTLWAWVREHHPDLRTAYGGEEADFAHSHSTWANIISKDAEAVGIAVVGSTGWSINDTAFAEPARRIAAAGADILVVSAHAPTTCGVLAELARQGVHPKLVVGLTSASTPETLTTCAEAAEGLLIPTSFIAKTPETVRDAAAVALCGGVADLHGMSAWEILYAVKQVIEDQGILGKADDVAADRRRLRDGLARLTTIQGVLGTITRRPDRESLKPFDLVQARQGRWEVVYTPPGR